MIFPGKKKRGLGLDPDEIFADSVSALRNKESGTEGKIEKPLERLVSILFLLVAGAGIMYLLYRAGELQIKEGRTFFSKSQENRFFVRSVLPPRGVIYDRWGEPLVENMPSFGLAFERQGFLAADKDLHSFLAELVVVLGKDISFFLDLGFPSDFDSSKLPRRIVITQNLYITQPKSIISWGCGVVGIIGPWGGSDRGSNPRSPITLHQYFLP